MSKKSNVPNSKGAIPNKVNRSMGSTYDSQNLNPESTRTVTYLDASQNLEAPASEATSTHKFLWRAKGKLSVQELSKIRGEYFKYGQYMHTVCHSCGGYYDKETPPYIQTCGVSICSKCNKAESGCKTCFQVKQNGKSLENQNNLNKDLENNYSLIVAGLQNLDSFKIDNEIIPTKDGSINVGDEIMIHTYNKSSQLLKDKDQTNKGAEELKGKLNEAVPKFQKYMNAIKDIRLALETKDVHSSLTQLSHTKDDHSSLTQLSDGEDPLYCLEQVDLDAINRAVYQFFNGINLIEDILFGLRITEFKYDVCPTALENNLAWTAVSTVNGRSVYCPIHELDDRFILGCKSNFSLDGNVVLIEYESFKVSHKPTGFIFQLEDNDGGHKPKTIDLEFDDNINSQIYKQIFALCTGEDGPCYKGGNVCVSDECIMIESYISDGNYCSDDIVCNIPDNITEKICPTKGMVSAPRLYKEGACLCITKKRRLNIPEAVIGSVMNPDILNVITGKSYKIKFCGIYFRK